MLHPYSVINCKQIYRLFTADLIHNDPFHLIVNETVLYFASGSLEVYLNQHYIFGSLIFVFIYFVSMISGSLMVAWRYCKDFDYSSSGASGSAIGTMFGYMILQPHVAAFYLPLVGRIQNIYGAVLFVIGFVVYQLRSKNPMINNELHLYSAIGGAVVTMLLFRHLIF